MEIDTGVAVCVILQKILQVSSQRMSKQLQSGTRQLLELLGEAKVGAKVKGKKKMLKVYIAKEECPAEIG